MPGMTLLNEYVCVVFCSKCMDSGIWLNTYAFPSTVSTGVCGLTENGSLIMLKNTVYILLKHMGRDAVLSANVEYMMVQPDAELFIVRYGVMPDTDVVPMPALSLANGWLDLNETVAPGTETPNRVTVELSCSILWFE